LEDGVDAEALASTFDDSFIDLLNYMGLNIEDYA
jgi:hypothetical protein